MNKQELIAHFQEQKRIIEAEIAFWQAQPDDEAEKPKLRHGDFGINFDKKGKLHFTVIAIKRGLNDPSLDIIYKDGSRECRNRKDDVTWFGNIFALLKEWSEDLEKWNSECTANGMEIEKEIIKLYFCTGAECTKEDDHCHFNLAEAEEIWHKLGQMIMTLKRKQSKT